MPSLIFAYGLISTVITLIILAVIRNKEFRLAVGFSVLIIVFIFVLVECIFIILESLNL